ncbi:hypothetical protein RI129_006592 [Pyrocoelia pectoralis]|uniref:Medium-chain acyl-CoA ligase ACSF2, mitochondrial n=1 Tax=Pyrocoelia pectoralis TaxID=417401 RepID=A0AAN7ZJT1_9COLE
MNNKNLGFRTSLKSDEISPISLSYIHNPGSEPLKYITIGQLLEDAAIKFPTVEAVVSVYDNKRITYKEVLHQSDKLAAGFLNLGLEKGDKIALWAPNVLEWIVAFFAAVRAGLITVALNPNYQAPELKHALNTTGAKVLICLDKYKALNFYGTLQRLIPELGTCNTRILSSENVPSLKTVITISKAPLRGTCNYFDILNAADVDDITAINRNQHLISPNDICNIQFSSGTTGIPKAIGLTHFQMVNNGYMIGKRIDLHDDQHKFCIQVPLFYVFGTVGCTIASTHYGTTLVFPAPIYNSTANLTALEEERCTIIAGTPTMYVDLISVQNRLNKNVCVYRALVAGAPWSPSLVNSIKEVLKIQQLKFAYGATEMTAVAFHTPSNTQKIDLIGSDGYIGEHLEAKVVDRNQEIVPVGTPGELHVRGYVTMTGYLGDPDKTKEVLDEENWYRTGDHFILYKDGSGKVVGRLKDMIIRGGENISPKEVEDFLNTHPDIEEIYVIGIENKRLGEEVCACVRLREGTTLNLDSLRSFCTGNISNYKIPSLLKVVESFPKTTSGKIQKFLLKEQFNQYNRC